MSPSDSAALKRAAAARALDFIAPGMKLGLGTGSTAEALLDLLAPKIAAGLKITGVATSQRTADRARKLGIPIAELDDTAPLDLTIDGADEADRNFDLIKGGGGALLREKIVATSSRAMVVIADGSKLVDPLGAYPLPVEVIGFGARTTISRIEAAIAALGYGDIAISLRMAGDNAFRTDSGNLIFDCAFGAIADAPALARVLSAVPGVVDHGLFIGVATTLVIARADGVEVLTRKSS